MKRKEPWIVGTRGIRPAGPPDKCLYCGGQVGAEHLVDCTIRQRTIVARVSVDILLVEPESWTVDDLEFRWNESSSCANNLLERIRETVDRRGEESCMCSVVEAKYLREATEEDEEFYKLRAEDLKG